MLISINVSGEDFTSESSNSREIEKIVVALEEIVDHSAVSRQVGIIGSALVDHFVKNPRFIKSVFRSNGNKMLQAFVDPFLSEIALEIDMDNTDKIDPRREILTELGYL